jgi:AcrR family transcriptional regulator
LFLDIRFPVLCEYQAFSIEYPAYFLVSWECITFCKPRAYDTASLYYEKNMGKNTWQIKTNVLNYSIKQLFRDKSMKVLSNKNPGLDSDRSVQDRLLDAAEELFCERGFDDASVRKIAAEADCNLAAVNYYFGGKEKLYIEVWRRHLRDMRETRLASIDKVMSKSSKPRLEDLLRSFANAFVGSLIDESKGPRFIKLMIREMLDRRLPGNLFFEELIIPTMNAFSQALMKICKTLDKSKAQLVIISFIGQLLQTFHVKAMFEQIDNPELLRFDLTQVLDHIVVFSAAGIRACAGDK